jgi:hypothetical protein
VASECVEYRGFEICVRQGWVVLGSDPMGAPSEGFVADIRTRDAQRGEDGHALYDFPFDPVKSTFHAANEDDAVAKAKAFIDEHAKPVA